MTRLQALADVFMALALLAASSFLALGIAHLVPEALRVPALLLTQGLLLLGGLRVLLSLRGQGWTDIGLHRMRVRDLARGLLAFVCAFGLNIVFSTSVLLIAPEIAHSHLERLRAVAELVGGGIPTTALVGLLVFVGIYEELFARGLLLRRCCTVLGGAWGPVLISSALFGLGHLYQGWMGVVQTALVGVVLAGFTIRWGVLWPAIVAHASLDILSIMLMRALPQTLS